MKRSVENRWLKRLLAEAMLDNVASNDIRGTTVTPAAQRRRFGYRRLG